MRGRASACLFLLGCGVRGDPVPPIRPGLEVSVEGATLGPSGIDLALNLTNRGARPLRFERLEWSLRGVGPALHDQDEPLELALSSGETRLLHLSAPLPDPLPTAPSSARLMGTLRLHGENRFDAAIPFDLAFSWPHPPDGSQP